MTATRTQYGLVVSTKTLDIPFEINVSDLKLVGSENIDTSSQVGFELTFKNINADDDSRSSYLYIKRLLDKKGANPKVRTTFRLVYTEVYDPDDGSDPISYETEDVHTINRAAKAWKGNAWTARAGALANAALMGVIDGTSKETNMVYIYNAMNGVLQPFA